MLAKEWHTRRTCWHFGISLWLGRFSNDAVALAKGWVDELTIELFVAVDGFELVLHREQCVDFQEVVIEHIHIAGWLEIWRSSWAATN